MKTVKHSTAPKKISKKMKRKELDSDMSLYPSDKRYCKVTPERLISLGKDLLLMFEEDKRMVSMLPWRQKHDLGFSLVDNYCKRSPELQEMIEEFKDRAGWRIFEQSLNRGDTAMAKSAMTMYSRMYRKSEKWRNNLRKDLVNAEKATTINVIAPDFPSSGKVPDRTSPDRVTKDNK